MPWQNVTPASQSWTTQVNVVQVWASHGIQPSSASRLFRIQPQSAITQEDLSFTWRVRTEGAWAVATGNGVKIRSGITEPF